MSFKLSLTKLETLPIGVRNKVVCLNNLLTIAKAQDNTGKVIERELQNTLMRLESVGC